MARPKSTVGVVTKLADGRYKVRVDLPDGSYTWRTLRERCSEAMARERALAWTAEAKRDPAVHQALALVAPPTTMAEWVERWIAESKARGQTSAREKGASYHQHIAPATEHKHVRDWTRDDLRALSRSLDEKVRSGQLAWKTGVNVWGIATKLCADACSSKIDALRVRDDNPALGVTGPDRGARKAKQFLYPNEAARFFACKAVPLRWRRAVALAIYLYPRTGELRMLHAEDVDLEHCSVHIHRASDRETGDEKPTKTSHARRVAIEPALLPLLVAMRAENPEAKLVIELPSDRNASRILKLWLKRAGIDRPELHETTPTRKAMTFYDLRATGITWRAIRGDSPLEIMADAGHAHFETTQVYIRAARAVHDSFGEVFPPLPRALLGLPDDAERGGFDPSFDPRRSNYSKSLRRGRDSNPR